LGTGAGVITGERAAAARSRLKHGPDQLSATREPDIHADFGDRPDILLGGCGIAGCKEAVDLPLRADDKPDPTRHVAIEGTGLLPDWPLRLSRKAHDKPQQRRTDHPEPSHAPISPL